MSWSDPGNENPNKKHKKRRGYHHGNLREALIAAALELIASKGPGGFTFAEAARAAGVSAAAPYRHFRDRDALVEDVARQGFERFEARLSQAWDQGRPHPVRALERVGMAYLDFAAAEPALYAAMFEAGLQPKAGSPLDRAGEQAFAVLRRAVEAALALQPADSRPPALMVSLHMWSMAHGIASLFARDDAGRRKLPMTPEELLEAGFLIYFQGLR